MGLALWDRRLLACRLACAAWLGDVGEGVGPGDGDGDGEAGEGTLS